MSVDIYTRLREQLDQYSIGFPASPSGVEIEILKKLFTTEDAELFLQMSLMIETPEEIAERIGRDPESVARQLEAMDQKGTVFCHHRGGVKKYGAVPFVLGIYEFQQNNINREMAELYEKYFVETLLNQVSEHEQLLRPIPVGRSIDTALPVVPYNDVREIIKAQKLIAVAPCLCRVQAGLLDKGCGKPLEVCFAFGSGAQHFIDKGTGRQVSVEEALKLQEQAEEAGLVAQPTNSQKPSGMCNCCGDCCAALRGLNKLEKPALAVVANYYAEVDSELCTGCEICLDRCQVNAVNYIDDVAEINLDRCIGCGLCITTCPSEAISLAPKPENQSREPVKSGLEWMSTVVEKRGTSIIPLSQQKAD